MMIRPYNLKIEEEAGAPPSGIRRAQAGKKKTKSQQDSALLEIKSS
jgi:hypothetical protein